LISDLPTFFHCDDCISIAAGSTIQLWMKFGKTYQSFSLSEFSERIRTFHSTQAAKSRVPYEILDGRSRLLRPVLADILIKLW
jgi:hypothetical protein